MENKRQFSVEKYSVSKYAKDPRFLALTMYVCCSNKKANDSIFSDESIISGKDTFINVPVVANIKQTIEGDDFSGHDMETKIDSDGQKYTNYIEKPIGMIPESGNVRLIPDSKDKTQIWIVVDALIWIERDARVAKILKRRNGKIAISMEVNFDKYKTIDGIDYVDKFTALAVTLLSKNVSAAFKTSVATTIEQFSQFKEAFCFALKGEESIEQLNNNFESNVSHETDDENSNTNQNEQKRGDLVNYENMIMELMSAEMQGYEYMGYSQKAIYAFSSGKVYAIPYEVIDDTVKMSKESVYECSIYAKYAVTTMKEEEKVEGVAAKVDSEDPSKEKENQEEIEEFACGNKMSESYEKLMSEKTEMCGKYEELNNKYSENETQYADINAKFEDVSTKYEELNSKYEEVNSKYEETTKALSEYQNKEFSEKAFSIINEFKLKEDFKTEWVEKVNAYSDIEVFEKDLIHAIYKSNGGIEKAEKENEVVKYGINSCSIKGNVGKKKLEPMEALREQFQINNK